MFLSFVKNKKILSFFLIVFIMFFSSPLEIEAFWGFGDVSTDPANTAQTTISASQNTITAAATEATSLKETVFDAIAYAVAKEILSNMVEETTNWVNSGFDGNPSYISDPKSFMTNVSDEAIGDFIYNTDELKFLCSPFGEDVKLALSSQFTKKYDPKCTLSDVVDNIDTAIDDLGEEWNWDTWDALTQNPHNNAYGSYVEASIALNADINLKQKNWEMELDWGKGFKPMKKCENVEVENPNYNGDSDDRKTIIKEKCENVTMGDTISQTVNNSLNVGQETLIAADEIDELVGAVLVQVVSKALREGYRSLSEVDDEGDTYFGQKNELSASKALFTKINKSINEESQYKNRVEDIVKLIESVKKELDAYANHHDCERSGFDDWFKGKVVKLDRELKEYQAKIVLAENNIENLNSLISKLNEIGGDEGCLVTVDGEKGVFANTYEDGRPIYRFNKQGGEYCGGGVCDVVIKCVGSSKIYSIPSSGDLYENDSFSWEPISEGNSKLAILLPAAYNTYINNNSSNTNKVNLVKEEYQEMSAVLSGPAVTRSLSNIDDTYKKYRDDGRSQFIQCVAGSTSGTNKVIKDIIDDVIRAVIGSFGSMFSQQDSDSDYYGGGSEGSNAPSGDGDTSTGDGDTSTGTGAELCSPGKRITQGYSKDIMVDGIRQAAYVFPNPGPDYGKSFGISFSDGNAFTVSNSANMQIVGSKAMKYQPGGGKYGIKTAEVYAPRGTKPGSATLVCSN